MARGFAARTPALKYVLGKLPQITNKNKEGKKKLKCKKIKSIHTFYVENPSQLREKSRSIRTKHFTITSMEYILLNTHFFLRETFFSTLRKTSFCQERKTPSTNTKREKHTHSQYCHSANLGRMAYVFSLSLCQNTMAFLTFSTQNTKERAIYIAKHKQHRKTKNPTCQKESHKTCHYVC
jgi:hypothetical protein